MNKLFRLSLCLTLILSACRDRTLEKQSEIENNSTIVTSSDEDKTNQNQTQKTGTTYLISPTGISEAKLGMTLGEFKLAVDEDTQFELVSDFMVDVNAIAVTKIGKVQYYILFVTNTVPQDSDKITYLMTQNPQYQTKEGIKVGSTIKEAETAYGSATLSYNINNESREYVEFENFSSSGNINLRPNSIDYKGFAGIYSEPRGEYNQTKNYRNDAKIATIEVSCRPQSCP